MQAWGDDPPSHPVIHKSKGMDRVSPKPPLSDLAEASKDFDVFCNRQNRQNRQRGNGSPIFPCRRSHQNRQKRHSWSMVFRRAFEPLRLAGTNKDKGMDPSKIKFHQTQEVLNPVFRSSDIYTYIYIYIHTVRLPARLPGCLPSLRPVLASKTPCETDQHLPLHPAALAQTFKILVSRRSLLRASLCFSAASHHVLTSLARRGHSLGSCSGTSQEKHVYIYIYIYIHKYVMCVYIYIYHIHMYMCVCVYIYIYIYRKSLDPRPSPRRSLRASRPLAIADCRWGGRARVFAIPLSLLVPIVVC